MHWIKFYLKLTWFKHLSAKVDRELERAQKRGKAEDEEEIYHEFRWEIEIARHAIQALQTRYYLDVAHRKGIPTSYQPTDWEENMNQLGARILTVEAIARLRSAIRQETKELRDIWLPIASLVISFVALSIAVLNYRKPSAKPIVQLVQTPQQQVVPNSQSTEPSSKGSEKTKPSSKRSQKTKRAAK